MTRRQEFGVGSRWLTQQHQRPKDLRRGMPPGTSNHAEPGEVVLEIPGRHATRATIDECLDALMMCVDASETEYEAGVATYRMMVGIIPTVLSESQMLASGFHGHPTIAAVSVGAQQASGCDAMSQGASHFASALQYLVVFPGLTIHRRDHGHVKLAQSSVAYGTAPIARFPVDRRIVVAPSAMSLETATQERLVGFHNAVQQPKSDPTQTPQESMAPAKDRGRRHRQLGMDREAFHRTEIVAQKPRVGTPLIGMPKTRKGRSRQRRESRRHSGICNL